MEIVVGRAESTIVRTPDFAKNAAVVGFIFNINTEKVVELKPGLIVAYKGMHEKYIQLFEAKWYSCSSFKFKNL